MDFLDKYLDFVVVGILALMSFVMLACVIERFIFLSTVNFERYATENEMTIAATNRLAYISSVAANAPYIGLLGTVFGILLTFHTMGTSNDIEASKIMTGLALALKATAFGLMVAIPATMFYTALLRKAEVVIARWEDYQFRQNKVVS